MIKYFTLALITFNVFAQDIKAPEYIPLASQKVFDVEIIVFAYTTALPNAKTYRDKPIFDDSLAYSLNFKPEEAELIKNESAQNTDEEFTINIDKKESPLLALAWFEHQATQFQLNSIWDKLQAQESTTPLIHRAWRQPETLFESPQFVRINTLTDLELDTEENYKNISIDENLTQPNNKIIGQVALSKGRYMHFTNQINLVKTLEQVSEDDRKNMIFSLTERQQVKNGELHYFDNPWFGTLVKVTQFDGEQSNEDNNE